MGNGWKLVVAVAALILSTMTANARNIWDACADQSDHAAGHAACSRLIASGKAGAMLWKVHLMRAFQSSSMKNYEAAITDFGK